MKLTLGGEKSTGGNYADRTKQTCRCYKREEKQNGKMEKEKGKGERGRGKKKKEKKRDKRKKEKTGTRECCFFYLPDLSFSLAA